MDVVTSPPCSSSGHAQRTSRELWREGENDITECGWHCYLKVTVGFGAVKCEKYYSDVISDIQFPVFLVEHVIYTQCPLDKMQQLGL